MCQSQAEGGQRCAAGTRPEFDKQWAERPGSADFDRAAIEHATTATGYHEVLAKADEVGSTIGKERIIRLAELGLAEREKRGNINMAVAFELEKVRARQQAEREARIRRQRESVQRFVPSPRVAAAVSSVDTSGAISLGEGTYPGEVELTSKYEGVLLDAAEKATEQGLFVHLKNGTDVYGDPEDGFTITVSEHDDYGDANYWSDSLVG